MCFIDPDDFIDARYLSTLYDAISSQRADVAFCGFNNYYEDTGALLPERFKLKKTLPQTSDYLFAYHIGKTIPHAVWCFLYRRDFLISAGIRFNERCCMSEDAEFVHKALLRSSKTVFVNVRLYNYVHHKAQITAVRLRDGRAPALKRQSWLAETRAARHSRRYCGSGKLRRAVLHIQEPNIMLAPFAFYSRRGDWENYKRSLSRLRHRKVREVMHASVLALHREPELFFKCWMVLHAPKLFYWLRARKLPRS